MEVKAIACVSLVLASLTVNRGSTAELIELKMATRHPWSWATYLVMYSPKGAFSPVPFCSDDIDDTDAHFVCRRDSKYRDGFRASGGRIMSSKNFRFHHFAPHGLRCTGTRSPTGCCAVVKKTNTTCASGYPATVNCNLHKLKRQAKYRFENISTNSYEGIFVIGLPDIRLHGEKYICADGDHLFGVNEAKVACKSLGKPSSRARAISVSADKILDIRPEDYLLSDVTCRGDERTLQQCRSLALCLEESLNSQVYLDCGSTHCKAGPVAIQCQGHS